VDRGDKTFFSPNEHGQDSVGDQYSFLVQTPTCTFQPTKQTTSWSPRNSHACETKPSISNLHHLCPDAFVAKFHLRNFHATPSASMKLFLGFSSCWRSISFHLCLRWEGTHACGHIRSASSTIPRIIPIHPLLNFLAFTRIL
jgi:hypothetical protein